MQHQRPLAYINKAIGVRNMGLSIYEKELLALVTAISKWRHYLEGHQFIVKTDHQALKFLLEQRITTPLQQKWLTKLLGLNYEIVYKKGIENRVADALSRRHKTRADCTAISSVVPLWIQELEGSYQGDLEAKKLIAALMIDPNS